MAYDQLGFTIGNYTRQGLVIFGVKVPSSIGTEAEWYALDGGLGTGVFQAGSGAASSF